MKRGFTLVEMLVILIFLSLIFLFAVPSTINMLKKSEDDKYNLFLNDVYLATEAYLENNKDDYPNLNIIGAKTNIYMKDLVDEGLISTNLVNPKYCVDDVCSPKKIAECTDKTCSVDDYTITVTKDEDGKYVYSFKQGIAEECEYSVGQEFLFDYTGSVQTFTPKCSGNYKLEVWGAQGGNSHNFLGGYGAYSVGSISLDDYQNLSIVVGGAGSGGDTTTNTLGGYNGGGVKKYSASRYPSSGGGATHISYSNSSYNTLSSYSNETTAANYVLIVAGGGGGATYQSNDTCGAGGSGGGFTGSSGIAGSSCSYAISEKRYGTGGTQTSGGTTSGCYNSDDENKGKFGQGASNSYSNILYHISGGGGGWYGGGADGCAGAGGGGSGWIASSKLISTNGVTKHMTCYNCTTSSEVATKTESNTCHNSTATADCSKDGNGYAKITYLGE